MTSTDPYRGLSAEDRARAVAHNAERLAIQRAREEAARRLLAPAATAKAVKDAWGPVRDALEARKAQAVTGGQDNAERPGGGKA